MTLKDFHGGSIPSDLPLPSAPGLMGRPSDRSPFDRQIPAPAWGNQAGRSDHRPRPGSAGTTRSFDEKVAFLSHPPHLGRNFEEDERKPFEGGISSSRRSVRDDDDAGSRLPSSGRQDSKLSSTARQASVAVSHSSPAAAMKIPTSVTNSQFPSSNNGQIAGSNSVPNAWAVRREGVERMPSPTLTGPSVASKFAQASALEKISSGRWQTKPAASIYHHHVPDVEVIRYSETESDNIHYGMNPANGPIEYESEHGRHGEGGGTDLLDNERGRNSLFYSDGDRPASTEGKFGGSWMQSQLQMPSELSERPKLKLLPRTKPLEPSESHVGDFKQVHQPPAHTVHAETVNDLYGNVNPPKPGSAGGDGVNHAIAERPKLNLKPRSQPFEQPGSRERERKALFGGARPRELVLKERGVDDVVINNIDMSQPVNRVKQDVPKVDTKLEAPVPNPRYGERPGNFTTDQRPGRDLDRRDHRLDTEKTDMQRGSWRNENRKNNKDLEKPHEKRQEPETWRRPVEPPKHASPEMTPSPRYGKAASALELAQAFSRPVSVAKSADRPTSHRNLPGRSQVPFSRLTDTREFYSGPTPRQINGY